MTSPDRAAPQHAITGPEPSIAARSMASCSCGWTHASDDEAEVIGAIMRHGADIERSAIQGRPNCPPWCVTDHAAQLTACSAPAPAAIVLASGAAVSARARGTLAFGEHVLVSGISGVHATDAEDAACLATLLDVLASATPEQHRELAVQVRAAAALIWGDR